MAPEQLCFPKILIETWYGNCPADAAFASSPNSSPLKSMKQTAAATKETNFAIFDFHLINASTQLNPLLMCSLFIIIQTIEALEFGCWVQNLKLTEDSSKEMGAVIFKCLTKVHF